MKPEYQSYIMSRQDLEKPPERNVRYMSTTSAYDRWAKVYDTDGNFLQALDTIEMKELLPRFLSLMSFPQPWTLVDLGCGTGRNLLPLLRVPEATVIGLEPSAKMRSVAQSRVDEEAADAVPKEAATKVDLLSYDMIEEAEPPSIAQGAHGLFSTLVLEHVPLDTFFKSAAQILRDDGVFLVTNMHSEMGDISQAGFHDPETGEKIRPLSYSHRIQDVLRVAAENGFRVEGKVLERGVDSANCQLLGDRAQKWLGVLVWFGIIFRKGNLS